MKAEAPPARESEHEREVARIAAEIRHKLARGLTVHITKDSGHHVVPVPGDSRFGNEPIDISRLSRILSLDPEKRVAVVEPGVTFRELVAATLEHRLIPAVVPELEGITVGGAVAGCCLEAMSYRYGGFHDNCLEYEIITGDGRVLRCDQRRDRRYYEMIHGSYGTLGILSRIVFRLLPAKPFVRMAYRHLPSFERFESELLRCCRECAADFIDGIIHSPRHFVLCLGRFVETAPYVSDYRRDEVFYQSTAKRSVDYLSTIDYCFRYDTDCHWLTHTVPLLEYKLVRRLLHRHLLGSTNLIRWSNRLARLLALKKRPDVVCDVFIPDGRFADFFRWYERDFGFFPLWVVPYRINEIYPWVSPPHAQRMAASMQHQLVIDCAVYGKRNHDPCVDYSQLLEEKTFELDGIKTLISRNHYTEQRFWEIYNRAEIQAVKAELDPQGVFPGLFECFHRVE